MATNNSSYTDSRYSYRTSRLASFFTRSHTWSSQLPGEDVGKAAVVAVTGIVNIDMTAFDFCSSMIAVMKPLERREACQTGSGALREEAADQKVKKG